MNDYLANLRVNAHYHGQDHDHDQERAARTTWNDVEQRVLVIPLLWRHWAHPKNAEFSLETYMACYNTNLILYISFKSILTLKEGRTKTSNTAGWQNFVVALNLLKRKKKKKRRSKRREIISNGKILNVSKYTRNFRRM